MMIVLATDFGPAGPYMGQMRAVLAAAAPGVPVIDLFSDLPPFDPRRAAYVLAAHLEALPSDLVLVAVVDPGVGGPREAVVVRDHGRWLVGPDNGLFAPLVRRAEMAQAWRVPVPESASPSFHGRDVFAPVAAALACGAPPAALMPLHARALDRPDWPDDLAEVVYIDGYGNAMTGLRAATLPAGATVRLGDRVFPRVRTFGDVPPGAGLLYENANGLLELAVNQGRADRDLGLTLGQSLTVVVDS